MKETIEERIIVPENTEVRIESGLVSVKGQKGTVERKLLNPKINMHVADKNIIISSKKASRREKALIGTFKAHIRNMIKGAGEGHVYKLKICSGHFPMSVSVSGNEFIVKNFVGETIPRKLKLKKEVKVKIEGNDVIIECIDKEIAGQTASSIEELTKRRGFDKRVFQDGIYIYVKDGKEIK